MEKEKSEKQGAVREGIRLEANALCLLEGFQNEKLFLRISKRKHLDNFYKGRHEKYRNTKKIGGNRK